jgi:hypothetical protein
MIEALRVTWQSLKGFWEDFVLLVTLNLIWSLSILLMAAPIYLLGGTKPFLALALSFLLFWPLPIVSAALCFVTNQIAHGKAVGWGAFAIGLRRYWRKGLIVALINLVALGLIAANIQFYGFVLEGAWTNFAVSVWLVVGFYWLIAQIYWFPMILELESEKVLVALRNALTLVIISPGFSLVLAGVLFLLAAVCILLTVPAPLVMAGLLLLIINHATQNRLAMVRKKREARDGGE